MANRPIIAFAMVFITINIALAAARPGGFSKIDPTDPHVKFIAEFAVEEANLQNNTNLQLVKVVSAKRQIVEGTNYKLHIQAKVKGGGIIQTYKTVVFEGLPTTNPMLKLVSFKPVR